MIQILSLLMAVIGVYVSSLLGGYIFAWSLIGIFCWMYSYGLQLCKSNSTLTTLWFGFGVFFYYQTIKFLKSLDKTKEI